MDSKYNFDSIKLDGEKRIKIERITYPPEDLDISDLIGLSVDELNAIKSKRTAYAEQIYNDICEYANKWHDAAEQLIAVEQAIKYCSTNPIEHTSNEWKLKENGWCKLYERSNTVYCMKYIIREYELQWDIYIRYLSGNRSETIAGQTKRFPDEESMIKYLNGRIKAYDKYFTEVNPPVPIEYKDTFSLCGIMYPGYRLEGEQNG